MPSFSESHNHLPRPIQNQALLPWTAPRISTPFDAAKALIANAVNCPLQVDDIIVVLDKGGFGGMVVGCKFSKDEDRVLPNDYDSFFGKLCLAGWSALENIDNFNRGTSLTQICDLTRNGLVIQYNQYTTDQPTPDMGVEVQYDNAGTAVANHLVMTPRDTFWVFVPAIQPHNDYPISQLDSQESIGEYMLRQSIEHPSISFRLDLDSNPVLKHFLGRRNLFEIPSTPKASDAKQAI